MANVTDVASLSDSDLLSHLSALVARDRSVTTALVVSLGELDERRLFLAAGCSSLFAYCTQILRLSEHAAYGRIEAARCARRFPLILEHIADGSLTLTAVSLLRPVLTEQNAGHLVSLARNKTRRDVERLVAEIHPQPAVPTSVRKLPPPRVPVDQARVPVNQLAKEIASDVPPHVSK